MFGPLFGKELLEMARRRRYFLVRTLIGAVLLLGWWAALQGQTPTVAFKNIGALSSIGGGMFRNWAYWSLWGVVALTPMLVCGLIAAEKDGRTFETLLTTLLTNWEIVVGKAASRLLLLFILIASSIPILSVASLYGGFSAKQVVSAAAVLAAVALFVAVVGLYYSTITFKPYIALLRTYFFLALLWWLLPALLSTLDFWKIPTPWEAISVATGEYSSSPVQRRGGWNGNPVLFTKTTIEFFGWKLSLSEADLVVLSTAGVHLLIGFVLFRRTNRLLRVRLHPGKPPWLFTAAIRLYRSLVRGARRSVEVRKRSAGWSRLWAAEEVSERWWRRRLEKIIERNPLRFRNSVANAFDPERFVAAIQLFVGIGAIAAFLMLAWQERFGVSIDAQFSRVGLWGLIASVLLLFVCSIILASSAFARERQYGSWEVLTLADLPARLHLSAGVSGVAGTLRLLVIVIGALSVIVGYVWSGFVPLAVWLLSIIVLWLFVVVYSLWTSLFHRRIAGALAASVIGLGVIMIGPALLAYRDSGIFDLGPKSIGALLILSGLACWLASRGALSWVAIHAVATLLLTCVIALLTGDIGGREPWTTLGIGEYFVLPGSNNTLVLLAFPLNWGRRFAYGLNESLPDPRPAFAAGAATLLTTLAFLGSFRILGAAEPSEAPKKRRKRAVRPQHRQPVG